jgi:AraC-like DNA-binding protein
MQFDFNFYSTPLVFGFVQAWIYAVLFCVRAWRHERLSDGLFGCLLAAFSFEIWEYMLGFGGVEILWNELEFFPRNFSMLLPPLAWFYLKSQFNSDFRFRRSDLVHAAPFSVYIIYHLIVFVQGSDFVEKWKETVHFPLGIDYLETVLKFILQGLYFFKAYRLFQQYRTWVPTQFSNVETVSFSWFRNFLLAFFATSVTGWAMTLADLWLDLDFWHDWWDELFNAGLIYYLCIAGYAQTQPRRLHFELAAGAEDSPVSTLALSEKAEKISETEIEGWRSQIERLMAAEKPWLDPELTLTELARSMQTNPSILSAAINRAFGKNFNDFVNEYRVEAVKQVLRDPAFSHFSLLGIGLECGFNSKSTFNRAFRKATGVAPSGWADSKSKH